MKNRYKRITVWMLSVLISLQMILYPAARLRAAEAVPEELQNLYAQSAVLMDADSGRVLFEKNGYEKRPMASTTKILTCILALETVNLEQKVTVSENAARQPKVRLGMQVGEEFFLEDLLYSLMLESHNDSAVAVAEATAGSVGQFAEMMNQKAKELGCRSSYFITPNGLDGEDNNGIHSTTADDLARIMRYCIRKSPKRDIFLKITQTPSRTFYNAEKTRSFSCNNHNALLQMVEGALTGKTGFTSKAGYCYVGAVKRDERTFIIALLGCGWPGHKNWKWQDAKTLIQYAFGHYRYCEIKEFPQIPQVEVVNGYRKESNLFSNVCVQGTAAHPAVRILLRDDEKICAAVKMNERMEAPVRQGALLGTVLYTLNGKTIYQIPVLAKEEIHRRDLEWTLKKVIKLYLMQYSEIIK